MTHKEAIQKFKKLGLVNKDGFPVSLTGFKNRASIHKYGNKLKVVFVGLPKENMWGFYVMYDNDNIVMKDAHKMFLKLVGGDMSDFQAKDVQWGNAGIPLKYGDLRVTK
jgi:hypothetical protein